MEGVYYTFAALLGLMLGSFFNVVGLRIAIGESMVRPRSHCPHCQRTLKAGELIPVLSYLFIRGKCRGCGARISPVYPAIEISTSILFTITPWLAGWSKETPAGWTLISLLVIIVVSDVHYHIIPDRVLAAFAVIFIPLRLISPLDPWWNMFLGAGIGFGVLLLIAVVSKGGMGGGDIKLFAVLGIVLGWDGILLAFFFSALYGSLIGGIGMLVGKIRRGEPMPFGPAIALGSLTAYFFGDKFIELYVRLITV